MSCSRPFKTIFYVLLFSLSLTDYFAHDDALEPVPAVVCEVLRSDLDMGSQLRLSKASFFSPAQCYQKQRPAKEKDFEFSKKHIPRPRRAATSHVQIRRTRAKRFPLYKFGLCFDFQSKNSCDRQSCRCTHECANCQSSHHGEFSCPENC